MIQTTFISPYLILISEASSLYILKREGNQPFWNRLFEKEVFTNKSGCEDKYDCSMNEIDSKRRLQIAESLMFRISICMIIL